MLRQTGPTRSQVPLFLPLLAAALLAALPAPLSAQLPTSTLETIFPAGGQTGTTVEVEIRGKDLDEARSLHFSHQGIAAKPKMAEADDFHEKPYPVRGRFVVSIKKDVPPGIYEVRVVSRFGISNPRAFVVGSLPEVLKEGNPNRAQDAMPVKLGSTVNARAKKAAIDYYAVDLKKGQDMLVDCWGQRIDSRMNPTLMVTGPSGKELARARDVEHRDAVVHVRAPRDGTYTVAVWDFLYDGGDDYPYRLSLVDAPYIDFIFPPVGEAGKTGQYTIYGRNLPAGKPANGMTVGLSGLEQQVVKVALPGGNNTSRLPIGDYLAPYSAPISGKLFRIKGSNPALINYAAAPVVVEKEPENNDQPQAVKVPCEYAGQFYPYGDKDWISFEAKKGEVYWINLVSHRLGVAADPLLVVERVTQDKEGKEQIKEIAAVDDPKYPNNDDNYNMKTDDPWYRLRVDQDATYRVMVKDLYNNPTSDPRFVYRLQIQQQQPDFQLVAFSPPRKGSRNEMSPSACVLRKGGAAALRLQVLRKNGFDGEVAVSVEGLPAGVTCAGASIGGKVRRGWLVFESTEKTKPWAGPIRIVGKAKINGKDVTRTARAGALLWAKGNNDPVRSRMIRDITLAVIDAEQAPVSIQAGDGKLLETSLGGKFELPVKLTKREKLKGAVKVAAVGLPKNFQDKEVNIKGNDGKMQFEVRGTDVPVGTYTFYLRGETKFNYKRNQDAVKRAEAEQKRLSELLKQLTGKRDEAKKAQDEANRAAQDAANKLKQAQQNHQNAEKASQEAAKRVQQAEKKLADAKKAAAADKDDKGKQEAVKKAEQELADVKKQAADAANNLADAKKAFDEAQKKQKAAEKKKQETEEGYKLAEETRKQAEDLKKQADNRVKNEKNRNKPKDVTLSVVSSPVRVRVERYPIKPEIKSPGKIKQGQKVEVPVSIQRKYGFNDNVDIDFELPGGVRGISGKRLRIDKGKNAGKLALSINKDATPGKHRANLEMRFRFNNVTLELNEPFEFEVEKVEEKKKK